MYKSQLPEMLDWQSIRVYISCVAQGIQLGVFTGREANQLLYAAQNAQHTFLTRPAPRPAPRPRPDNSERAKAEILRKVGK